MPIKILIMPDKFKGTLTALAAAEAIASGWRQFRPQDRLHLLPMSDGGDGFGDVFSRLAGAEKRTVTTLDAAHRDHQADWWFEPKTRTAIIESARIIGLALLPPRTYHPFQLDTWGLGEVIKSAAAAGARRCIVGIGGSATNDGGFGLAQAMGWQFINPQGGRIEKWTGLCLLARLRAPKRRRWFREFIVAVDVRNRLLGAQGASRIYGPQKGLQTDDFPLAEKCLGRLAAIAKAYFQADFAREPGSGAAGGLGFGLRSFLGARLESGFDLFARYARLERRVKAVQLVITGEGAIDASTMMGKGVGQVAKLCRVLRVPCIGLAGRAELPESQQKKSFRVLGLTPNLTSPNEAQSRPAYWLTQLAAQVARDFEANE